MHLSLLLLSVFALNTALFNDKWKDILFFRSTMLYKLHFWWSCTSVHCMFSSSVICYLLLFCREVWGLKLWQHLSCQDVWTCGPYCQVTRSAKQKLENWLVSIYNLQHFISKNSKSVVLWQMSGFGLAHASGVHNQKLSFISLLWNNSNSDQIENCHRLRVFRLLLFGGICCHWKVLW